MRPRGRHRSRSRSARTRFTVPKVFGRAVYRQSASISNRELTAGTMSADSGLARSPTSPASSASARRLRSVEKHFQRNPGEWAAMIGRGRATRKARAPERLDGAAAASEPEHPHRRRSWRFAVEVARQRRGDFVSSRVRDDERRAIACAEALGLSDDQARASLRPGLSRFTTDGKLIGWSTW